MQLLTFAHRGEAKAFFEHLELEAIDGNTLYKFTDGLVLIMGEGVFDPLSKVSKVLALYPEISEIINLGVAGALNPNLNKDEVIQVRSSYLELEGNPQFHSFTMRNRDLPFKKEDCLTSSRRVLSKEQAQKLLPFAGIVDRELWAVARANKENKLPMTSLKVISDIPSEESEQICQVVKESALKLSTALYNAWSQIDGDQLQPEEKVSIPYFDQFHFTRSMSSTLQKRCHQLEIKFPDNKLEELIDFNSIVESEMRPKEKAIQILDEMNRLINPYRISVEERLKKLTHGLTSTGLTCSFDPHLEKSNLHIKGTFSNPNELKKVSEQLSKFDFEKMKSILEGDDRV
ncbi:MAG: hypothetical protein KC493_06565 [Bacteriovoracaceae bacterium]|nr:hypothetical protein [Bacteriovoracaceae bacterium]